MDLLIEKYKKYEPFFGGWYIKSLLGEGGYGAVFEVEKIEFDTNYKAALKIVSIPQSESELKSMLSDGLDEASTVTYYEDILHKMMGEIDLMVKMKGHSNIVSCEDHQVIPHDGSIGWDIIIRMELLTPIVDYQKTHQFTERDVIELGLDICEALEVCKRYKIIHRDIKPENIFVSNTGNYKLGDFGIARTMENTRGASTKAGTGRYMAPEVYRGERYNDTVDLYSLGLVLYRYLNENRLPFYPPYPQPIRYSDQEMAQEKRISGEILPKAIHASEEITKIINKACAFKPGDRYQSAVDMKNDLLQLKKIRGGATEADTVSLSSAEKFMIKEEDSNDKTEVVWQGIDANSSNITPSENKKEIIAQEAISISKNEKAKTYDKVKIAIIATLMIVAFGICGYRLIDYFHDKNRPHINVDQNTEGGNAIDDVASESIDETNVLDIEEQAEVDGIKVGEVIEFGFYEQDDNLDNGAEPIEWIVLDNKGDELTLLSVYNLDVMPYNEDDQYVKWETCSVREWLNNDFYNNAFNKDEKTCIKTTTVVNEDNLTYQTNAGQDTKDSVYLLSIDEVNTYSDSILLAENTAYVTSKYALDNDAYISWWLRSPGNTVRYAAVVDSKGAVSDYGSFVNSTDVGVRPVIKVDYAVKQELDSIDKYEYIKEASIGDVVKFGSYEQDNNDIDGKEEIEWYVLDNNGHEVILLSVYNLDAIPYNEEKVNVTWENCSLRKWLNDVFYNVAFTNEEKATIMETLVVNDSGFIWTTSGGNDTYDKVYLLSLREIEEYFGIPENRIDSPIWNGTCNDYYKYAKDCYEIDNRIIVKNTTYAIANGAENNYYGAIAFDYSGNCKETADYAINGGQWWLRSPGNIASEAAVVDHWGGSALSGFGVDLTDVGVRPVIKIGY